MNVLLVNTYDNGGAAKACIRLHQGLLKQGFSSKILFRDPSQNEIQESYYFQDFLAQKPGYEQIKQKVKLHLNKRSKGNMLKSLPKGYEPFRIAKSPFDITTHPLYEWADIINLHWVADFLDEASFFVKNSKPIVWTLHDMLAFTGGYHYKMGLDLNSYDKLIQENLSTKNKAYKDAKITVVPLSRWLSNESKHSSLLGRFPHSLIPNGLDTQVFSPIQTSCARSLLGIPREHKTILFVSESLTNQRKGFTFLIESLDLLPKGTQIALIGSGKEKMRNKHEINLGRIIDERLMAAAYSAADLFVIPSVEDNLPNTVVESLCCGTPVVGFNIGGIPDMIQPGFNGFICPEISSDALAKTIQKALEYSFDREAIRKDSIERYDQSVQADAYIELFNTLVP